MVRCRENISSYCDGKGNCRHNGLLLDEYSCSCSPRDGKCRYHFKILQTSRLGLGKFLGKRSHSFYYSMAFLAYIYITARVIRWKRKGVESFFHPITVFQGCYGLWNFHSQWSTFEEITSKLLQSSAAGNCIPQVIPTTSKSSSLATDNEDAVASPSKVFSDFQPAPLITPSSNSMPTESVNVATVSAVKEEIPTHREEGGLLTHFSCLLEPEVNYSIFSLYRAIYTLFHASKLLP